MQPFISLRFASVEVKEVLMKKNIEKKLKTPLDKQ
jgi:hypothetical protein